MRPVELIRKIMPACRKEYLQAFEQGEPLFVHYGVTTPKRMAYFVGQFGAETGGGSILYEDLSYTTTKRLLEIFGVGNHTAAITAAEAPSLLRNPVALAERVYGLKNPRKAKELGNTRPGDGGRYRGTGILQTTGGYNFKKAGEKVGVDFYNHPELIVSPEHALKPALWEWDHSHCNQMADAGQLLSISRAINTGNANSTRTPNGMQHRQEWTARAIKALQGQTLTLTAAGTPVENIPPRVTQPTRPLTTDFGRVADPVKPPPVPAPLPAKPVKVETVASGGVIGATGVAVTAASNAGLSWMAIIAIAFCGVVVAGAAYAVIRHWRK